MKKLRMIVSGEIVEVDNLTAGVLVASGQAERMPAEDAKPAKPAKKAKPNADEEGAETEAG